MIAPYNATEHLRPESASEPRITSIPTLTLKTDEPPAPRVCDLQDMNEAEIASLKTTDAFLFYSMPEVRAASVRNAAYVPARPSSEAMPAPASPTKVARQTRISFECDALTAMLGHLEELSLSGSDGDEIYI